MNQISGNLPYMDGMGLPTMNFLRGELVTAGYIGYPPWN